MFEAYITNTALYPLMGIEVGTTVHFPMTTQELQAALAKIGIDGKRYSEVFFTSFDSDVLGLYDYLYECENIDELNELGHALLEVRDKGGLETFEAALVLGNHTRSVKDLINLTQNLDLYRFYPDISDDEGLGRLYADELGTIDIPERIQNYFDYEAYGRDVRINEGGVFAPGGYVSAVPEGFKEYYHGPQDIPPEHRIFAYPEKAEPVLLRDRLTASYCVAIWKMLRKKGCVPSALTQNVKDFLASPEIENIFENSDFLVLLSQAQGDRQILAKQLGISPHQLSYVTHTNSGEGLLFFGNTTIPFVDRFPQNTELYAIMTTRPEDKKQEMNRA